MYCSSRDSLTECRIPNEIFFSFLINVLDLSTESPIPDEIFFSGSMNVLSFTGLVDREPCTGWYLFMLNECIVVDRERYTKCYLFCSINVLSFIGLIAREPYYGASVYYRLQLKTLNNCSVNKHRSDIIISCCSV